MLGLYQQYYITKVIKRSSFHAQVCIRPNLSYAIKILFIFRSHSGHVNWITWIKKILRQLYTVCIQTEQGT